MSSNNAEIVLKRRKQWAKKPKYPIYIISKGRLEMGRLTQENLKSMVFLDIEWSLKILSLIKFLKNYQRIDLFADLPKTLERKGLLPRCEVTEYTG